MVFFLASNRKIAVFLLIICSLMSCKNKEETENMNETVATQKVLNFYGGVCVKSKGVEYIGNQNKDFFELEISKSKLLDLQSKKINSHSANIAYLFYTGLGNRKSNYDGIRIKINLSNGKHFEFKYSKSELEEINEIKPYLDKICSLIINDDFDGLYKLFDNRVKVTPSDIGQLIKSIKTDYGEMLKIQFQGFEFKKSNNFGDVIIFNQALVLRNAEFSLVVIISRHEKKIISIEFE